MACVYGGQGSNANQRHALRRWWRTLWIADGKLTADILRYTEASDGNASRGISNTATQDGSSTLTAQNVVVSTPGAYTFKSRGTDIELIRENEREFTFLDVAATTNIAANLLQLTDRILFEGRRWRPRVVQNDAFLGICSATAYLEDR